MDKLGTWQQFCKQIVFPAMAISTIPAPATSSGPSSLRGQDAFIGKLLVGHEATAVENGSCVLPDLTQRCCWTHWGFR